MSDASDDAFDAALRKADEWFWITKDCPTPGKPCEFFINDDGLYECTKCGRTTDL